MSYRSGYGGGYPSKEPPPTGTTSKGFSMNAVPPPSALSNARNKNQSNTTSSTSNTTNNTGNSGNLSKHGYLKMDSISQYSSLYSLGKRKAKTEDE